MIELAVGFIIVIFILIVTVAILFAFLGDYDEEDDCLKCDNDLFDD